MFYHFLDQLSYKKATIKWHSISSPYASHLTDIIHVETRLSIFSSIHTTVRHQSPNLWDLSIQLCKHNNITIAWHETTLKAISLWMSWQEFHTVLWQLNRVEFLKSNFLRNLHKSIFYKWNKLIHFFTTAMKFKSFSSETHFRLFHLIDLSYDCASHVNNFLMLYSMY